MVYSFRDGNFKFYTAHYGSWAGDKRIVFRVRLDTTPVIRAEQKGIKFYDRLYPASITEVDAWIMSHADYPVLKITE
jgi:hypothetical protein